LIFDFAELFYSIFNEETC